GLLSPSCTRRQGKSPEKNETIKYISPPKQVLFSVYFDHTLTPDKKPFRQFYQGLTFLIAGSEHLFYCATVNFSCESKKQL
ncbi:hypothetical protein, partial [Crocosphaera watsonii]|uniref:hypothetical protein n=1 Tax=Crocosphaera watsonii TaxID=263511 RepID=UPI001E5ABBF8